MKMNDLSLKNILRMTHDDHADQLATLAVVCKQSLERETALRAENESSQKALRLVKMYLEDGAPNSALRVAKEALK